jgi:hypothetical protein
MTCHPRIAMTVTVAAIVHATACGAAPRTFVSGNGSDTNPCSISAPCRGFVQAIAHTDPDGEIIVIDSAASKGWTARRALSN